MEATRGRMGGLFTYWCLLFLIVMIRTQGNRRPIATNRQGFGLCRARRASQLEVSCGGCHLANCGVTPSRPFLVTSATFLDVALLTPPYSPSLSLSLPRLYPTLHAPYPPSSSQPESLFLCLLDSRSTPCGPDKTKVAPLPLGIASHRIASLDENARSRCSPQTTRIALSHDLFIVDHNTLTHNPSIISRHGQQRRWPQSGRRCGAIRLTSAPQARAAARDHDLDPGDSDREPNPHRRNNNEQQQRAQPQGPHCASYVIALLC